MDTLQLTQAKERGVLINLKIGPVAIDCDAEFIHGLRPGVLEAEFSRQAAGAFKVALLNHLISAAKGGIVGVTASVHTYSGYSAASTKVNMSTAAVNAGLQKMGEARERLSHLLMHSNSHYDAVAGQIGTAAGLSADTARGGPPGLLGPKSLKLRQM